MDLTVISTFRCNSRCQMCYIWKNPTEAEGRGYYLERCRSYQAASTISTSPAANRRFETCRSSSTCLHPKARILEISSNGLHPERLCQSSRSTRTSKFASAWKATKHERPIRGRETAMPPRSQDCASCERRAEPTSASRWLFRTRTPTSSYSVYEIATAEGLRTCNIHAPQRLAVLQERQLFLRSQKLPGRSRALSLRCCVIQQPEELVPCVP